MQPTGAGTNIHDPVGNQVSSIIDQVTVQDLTGMGAYQEPYVKAEMEAQSQKVETAAGTARTATDPTFGIAELRPREVNVTSFVDRNIARLSPADYYAKVMAMAMRAMRRAIAKMIITGDGEGSPAMFGITNAKNKASENIFAEETITAIDAATTLDQLYFAYGSDVAIGANARLLLTKKNLKAFGALRGTNEKRRLLDIVPDMANPNTGIIRDGGVVIPYTISSDVTDQKLLYGDPANYLLGLFGGYTIRVDESVKGRGADVRHPWRRDGWRQPGRGQRLRGRHRWRRLIWPPYRWRPSRHTPGLTETKRTPCWKASQTLRRSISPTPGSTQGLRPPPSISWPSAGSSSTGTSSETLPQVRRPTDFPVGIRLTINQLKNTCLLNSL